MNTKLAGVLSVSVMWLTACSSTPPITSHKSPSTATSPKSLPPVTAAKKSGGYYLDDGPEANPPANLDEIPDAIPRREPLHRYANRAYSALGSTYVPDTTLSTYKQEGWASWYGKRFQGKKTASGELYDMYGMTAAHPTLPIPSYVRVTCLENGKSVIVRINDRGPFSKNRLIDLSYAAAHKLNYLGAGSTKVRVESIDPSQYDADGAAFDSGIYLQLGAFSTEEKAQKLSEKVRSTIEAPLPPVHVLVADKLHRVTLGPYATDADAELDSVRLQQNMGLASIKLTR